MTKTVLFIQGGGEDGYNADAAMVDSLRKALGNAYEVRYPQLKTNENRTDFGWPMQIGKAIAAVDSELILVGHSLGASLILKQLSEHPHPKNSKHIYLLATPFWQGNEEWVKGLMLKSDFADSLPADIPIALFHCRDDKEVSFDHLKIYQEKISWARIFERAWGGHLFDNDLRFLAREIELLA